MKILIIEDQKEKALDIERSIKDMITLTHPVEKKTSLKSGLRELVLGGEYDLLLLDMSMPRFDFDTEELDAPIPESFAGSQIMSEMQLRDINVPVIVVTQYSVFGENRTELKVLDERFRSKFPDFYLGSVYYSSGNNTWKLELEKLITSKFAGSL